MGKKRGPLAATDRRRNAGHKHPRHLGGEEDDRNGTGPSLAHLFSDRRAKNAEGKRAI